MRNFKKVLILLFLLLNVFLFGCKDSVHDYTLTYILNGELYQTVLVKSNEDIELERVKEKRGSVFSGWFLDEEYTIRFTDKRIKEDTTLYGYIIEGKYRISLVTNCDLVVEDLLLEKGDKIESLPELSRDGYKFKGWYRDEALEIPFNKDTFTVETAITLYAKWEEIEPEYVNIKYVSITEGYYANKDDIYVAYYSYFYDFLKNHTRCDLTNISLEDFLEQGKTWTLNGRSDMYHFGDKYSRYYLKGQKDGTLEEQPEDYFLGYCYKNGKFIDLINHLEEFFAYWRTDEGYTGGSDDPNNTGNDFYIEPWASMVDTAKFFYFTADTLNTKYSWFNSKRVKYALDHIPNVLLDLQNAKILRGYEYTITPSSEYNVTFFSNIEGTKEISKISREETNNEEIEEIIIYVKIEPKVQAE